MMKSGSPLYGAIQAILTIGLAAAAVLSVASPNGFDLDKALAARERLREFFLGA
jgi:hypothetical protein